jgi:pyruvate carboxylase
VWVRQVLDRDGPEAVAKWVLAQKGVLVTDTTMRDAHQSLLATRVRTVDIEDGAKIAGKVQGMTSALQRC